MALEEIFVTGGRDAGNQFRTDLSSFNINPNDIMSIMMPSENMFGVGDYSTNQPSEDERPPIATVDLDRAVNLENVDVISAPNDLTIDQISAFLADPTAMNLFGQEYLTQISDPAGDTLGRLADQYGITYEDINPTPPSWGDSLANAFKSIGQLPFENLLGLLFGSKRVDAAEDWIQENVTGPFGKLLGGGFDALTGPLQEMFGAVNDRMQRTGESWDQAIDGLKYNGVLDSLFGDREMTQQDKDALEEVAVTARKTTDPQYSDFVDRLRTEAGYGVVPEYNVSTTTEDIVGQGVADTAQEEELANVDVIGQNERAAFDEMVQNALDSNRFNVVDAGVGVGLGGGTDAGTGEQVVTGEDGLQELVVDADREQQEQVEEDPFDEMVRNALTQDQFNVVTGGTGVGGGTAEDALEELVVEASQDQDTGQVNTDAEGMQEVVVGADRGPGQQADTNVIGGTTVTTTVPQYNYATDTGTQQQTQEDTATEDAVREMQRQADTAATTTSSTTTTEDTGGARPDMTRGLTGALPQAGELYRNFRPRVIDMSMEDWLTAGQRPEMSFFENVPILFPDSPGYAPRTTTGTDGQPPREQSLYRGGSPRTSFAVRGIGDGRQDKIPAMLSDGEYVIDAETVALLGNGSSDAGAKVLDRFRVNVRKHKGKELSRGKFSVKAKSPEAYLGGKV